VHEARPINCVNWYQGYAFCIWDGGFLPSEAEWDYAAVGGSQQWIFPWGPTSAGDNAEKAIYGCYYNGMGPGTCTGVSNIAPVGSAQAGIGRYGQLDLAGNLYEGFLDSYVDTFLTPCVDCVYYDAANTSLVFRGGCYACGSVIIQNQQRTRISDRTNRSQNLGLRCARAP
jgi:formylglycine-generating enzyme required for sulfatase activity